MDEIKIPPPATSGLERAKAADCVRRAPLEPPTVVALCAPYGVWQVFEVDTFRGCRTRYENNSSALLVAGQGSKRMAEYLLRPAENLSYAATPPSSAATLIIPNSNTSGFTPGTTGDKSRYPIKRYRRHAGLGKLISWSSVGRKMSLTPWIRGCALGDLARFESASASWRTH
ncbi:hypothetical protein KM043_012618 [Ampulex compressa]|nr:hypothetical protein KM043_012618 [Ampulex compressa]